MKEIGTLKGKFGLLQDSDGSRKLIRVNSSRIRRFFQSVTDCVSNFGSNWTILLKSEGLRLDLQSNTSNSAKFTYPNKLPQLNVRNRNLPLSTLTRISQNRKTVDFSCFFHS